MSVLTEVGAAFIASRLFDQEFYIAWGTGQTWWDTNETEVFQFTANSKTLARQNISSVVVKSMDDVTTYASPADYSVNLTTGVLTRNVSGALANTTNYRVYYFSNRPSALASQTDLANRLGILETQVVEYVEVDEEGALSTASDEHWTISATPTPYIYISANYGYLDEPSATIKEVALVLNPTISGSPPTEQTYFANAEVSDIGEVLNIENIAPLERSVANKGTFAMVLRLI